METYLQANFYIKRDDLLPSISATLRDASGPVDLTGATVTFRMRAYGGSGAPKVEALATIVDAEAGEVRFDWLAGDTDTPGFYEVERRAVLASGKAMTFPNNGMLLLQVFENLAA